MCTKQELRRAARQRRKGLVKPSFANQIAAYAAELDIATGAVVGGYHALADEADPAQLLANLKERGCQIAYPRVVAKDLPLQFHGVPDGQILMPGAFGVLEPSRDWPRFTPSLLFVPLLAFDRQGYRLGYGGGYYDRTLAHLRVRSIGIAYAGQEVASLPREPHDMALDAIITETGIKHFR